jgi:hypothetical protein
VEANPDSATLRRQVAETLFSLGRADLATEQMSWHHRLRAEYFLRQNNLEEAAKEYEQALHYAPMAPELLQPLIELYDGPLAQPDKAASYRRRFEVPSKPR